MSTVKWLDIGNWGVERCAVKPALSRRFETVAPKIARAAGRTKASDARGARPRGHPQASFWEQHMPQAGCRKQVL